MLFDPVAYKAFFGTKQICFLARYEDNTAAIFGKGALV